MLVATTLSAYFCYEYDLRQLCHPELDSESKEIPGQARNDKKCVGLMNNIELIFVYNANSGVFAGMKDLIHKTVSQKTYGCNLCGLTYSGVSMKQEWKDFIDSLPVKATFLHKDEFVKLYPRYAMVAYPVAFKKENGILKEFISAYKINKQGTLEHLKKLVKEKVANL